MNKIRFEERSFFLHQDKNWQLALPGNTIVVCFGQFFQWDVYSTLTFDNVMQEFVGIVNEGFVWIV